MSASVPEVPPKEETAPATINVEETHQEATGAPVAADADTTAPATAAKVTPVQRINSVFNKAKQTAFNVYSEAQKAINEKKTSTSTAAAATTSTPAAADAPQVEEAATAAATTDRATTENKNSSATATAAFKDIFNFVKGFKPTASTTKAATVEPAVEQEVITTAEAEASAPVPPPKDTNANKSTAPNPVLDQLKRNTTLISNYLAQKKKEFTEKKASTSSADNNNEQQQESITPEVHDETATGANNNNKTSASASPLVRRITQLVNNATANINKKREPKKQHAATSELAVPAVVESTA